MSTTPVLCYQCLADSYELSPRSRCVNCEYHRGLANEDQLEQSQSRLYQAYLQAVASCTYSYTYTAWLDSLDAGILNQSESAEAPKFSLPSAPELEAGNTTSVKGKATTSLKDISVIAFAGYAGAGKGEASKPWVEAGWKCFSFATPIREICSRVYHVPLECFTDPQLKNEVHENLNGLSPRRVLQLIGTEGFRNLIDEDTWVKCLERDVLKFVNDNDSGGCQGIVIDDLRFTAEMDFLKTRGAITVYVNRPSVSMAFNHQSEAEIVSVASRCDLVLDNSGTLDDLWANSAGLPLDAVFNGRE